MDIEHYAKYHDFLYISATDIKRLCTPTLPFTGMGKTLTVQLPASIYAEVQQICDHDIFDYLLLSLKGGMTFDTANMRWVIENEDAFAWFSMRSDQQVKTSLRIMES